MIICIIYFVGFGILNRWLFMHMVYGIWTFWVFFCLFLTNDPRRVVLRLWYLSERNVVYILYFDVFMYLDI